MQTLRALVDLRVRKGGAPQPAARLTAFEAAALLKELGGELAGAGVDFSQVCFGIDWGCVRIRALSRCIRT